MTMMMLISLSVQSDNMKQWPRDICDKLGFCCLSISMYFGMLVVGDVIIVVGVINICMCMCLSRGCYCLFSKPLTQS